MSQFPEDSRQVVRGKDDEDNLVFGQVGIQEIDFSGRFGALGYSSSTITAGEGDHYFVMDEVYPKFLAGDDVLITNLDDFDCFMWGVILEKDTVLEPCRLKVYVDDVSDITLTSSNWELQVVARRKERMPPYQIHGLRIGPHASDGSLIHISSGIVRDFTDTVDLIYSDDGVGWALDLDWDDVQQGLAVSSANLAGTITSAGTAVTGTSTTFTTDFGDPGTGSSRASLEDYQRQCSLAALFEGTADNNLTSIIRSGSVTTSVTDVASNTALTTGSNLGATSATYKRGGKAEATSPALDYAIVIARSDTTGVCRPFACSFKNNSVFSAEPDLPTGYTYYRVLGHVRTVALLASPVSVYQPIRYYDGADAASIRYNNDTSGLTATNTQTAIDELASEKAETSSFAGTQYTPTLTNGTNVAASTAFACNYSRNGNMVTVSGLLNLDPTTTGLATVIGISLPVASNFGNILDCGGVASATSIAGESGGISANVANDRAQIDLVVNTAANHSIYFIFMYRVI